MYPKESLVSLLIIVIIKLNGVKMKFIDSRISRLPIYCLFIVTFLLSKRVWELWTNAEPQ